MNKSEYARFKRCLEWYCADPAWREKMEQTPEAALAELGYADCLDAQAVLQAIHWLVFRRAEVNEPADNPYISAARVHEYRVGARVLQLQGREGYASDRLFAYEQQVRSRCRMENRLLRQHELIYYYPFAFELSQGCSVQCPFCGFAAPRHEGDFLYTPENAALFRELVRVAYQYAGPVLRCCPLYFATEPLDDPDYEKFMLDFRAVTGGVPQTTTAVAEREPQRIRAWMAEIGEAALNEAALRFSLRTLAQFKKIAAEYTPDELSEVELLANNPESVHRYSNSGRLAQMQMQMQMQMDDKFPHKAKTRYSICCISGMKVNLVEKTVLFVEPELPDEVYPLGYRVRAARHFATAAEFSRIVQEFDAAFVHAHLPRSLPLCFNRNTRLDEEYGRYVFRGDGTGYQLGRNLFTENIISGIRANRSFAEMMKTLPLTMEDEERLYGAVDALFERGYVRLC